MHLILTSLCREKVNGRNGPGFPASSTSNIPGPAHHSKQRPPSPVPRIEEKRRTHEDKWKNSSSDKMLRDRTHTSRTQILDGATQDMFSNTSRLSSRLSKTNHSSSLEYNRVRHPPEPPESAFAKKKTNDKSVEKVCNRIYETS